MNLIEHELSTSLIKIYYLNNYISRSSGFTQDEFSKKILKFKSHDDEAFKYFYGHIETKISIGQKFMVCFVPSSRADVKWTACRELACKIRQNKKLKMGEHILYRKSSLPPQRIFRSPPQVHYDTFGLEKSFSHEIKNQHILLFDDVITTGHTFLGCAQFLLDNGAKKITGVILGGTKKWLSK